MREQILREMGLDYESLSKINPRLIYARCSGFGPNGPLKDMPVIDELAAARSGLMPTLPQPGQPPVYTGAGKPLTAIALAYGIILALYHCERTGEGQKVDVSCFGTNIIFQSCVFQGYLATYARGKPSEMRAICSLLEPLAREDCGNPLINMYRSKDGRWVYLAMPQTDLYWSDFCKAMGIEEFEHDVRFDNHEKRCGEGRKELGYILDKIFATRTVAEWIERFKGTNLIYDVVRTYAEVSNDVQALENSYIVELNHPSYGWVKTVGFPVELVSTPARICNLSSSVGQSTQAVLVDLLGYDLDRIIQMKKRGEIF
jgi:formyl-CoA transferase